MEKYFAYLEDLRDSGETNMWHAPHYLEEEFSLNKKEAKEVFFAWVKQMKGTS